MHKITIEITDAQLGNLVAAARHVAEIVPGTENARNLLEAAAHMENSENWLACV
jgi:hypothetical protein